MPRHTTPEIDPKRRPQSPPQPGPAPEAPAGKAPPPAGALSADERIELRIARAIADSVYASRSFGEAIRYLNNAGRILRIAERIGRPEARAKARTAAERALGRIEAADAALGDAIANCAHALDALGGREPSPVNSSEELNDEPGEE